MKNVLLLNMPQFVATAASTEAMIDEAASGTIIQSCTGVTIQALHSQLSLTNTKPVFILQISEKGATLP